MLFFRVAYNKIKMVIKNSLHIGKPMQNKESVMENYLTT